jgi:hypothetical protein
MLPMPKKRFASFAPFAPLRLPALRLCSRGVLWALRAGGLNAADAKKTLCVLCALRAFAFTRSASLLAWRLSNKPCGI